MALSPPPGFSVEHGLVGGPSDGYEPHGVEDVPSERGPATPPFIPATSIFAPPQSSPRPQTVAIALASFGLSPLLGTALMQTIGCGEEDDADALAALPEAEIPNIAKDLLIGDDMRPPTYFEKGTIYSFFKKLREAMSPAPAPTSKASSPAAPIMVTLPDTSDRLEYRDYLDQATRGSFALLTTAELRRLRDRYFQVTGAPTTGEIRPSDEQLSALSHRIRPQSDGSMKPPFTEFAVFGPHDARTIKLRQFHAHVLTREGTWQKHLLSGPIGLLRLGVIVERVRGSLDHVGFRAARTTAPLQDGNPSVVGTLPERLGYGLKVG